mgnify:CR=1 FL=1
MICKIWRQQRHTLLAILDLQYRMLPGITPTYSLQGLCTRVNAKSDTSAECKDQRLDSTCFKNKICKVDPESFRSLGSTHNIFDPLPKLFHKKFTPCPSNPLCPSSSSACPSYSLMCCPMIFVVLPKLFLVLPKLFRAAQLIPLFIQIYTTFKGNTK